MNPGQAPAAAVFERLGARRSGRSAVLAVGALGVVFGDIGTSPLYAFQDIFAGSHPIPVVDHRVFGAVSLVFWTLTLIVSVKYVLIVMRADNGGEGGVMALAALATSGTLKSKRGLAVLMMLGILGAALFYGDGMITPAVSVLSAVSGLEVADPGLDSWVLPIAIAVLLGLFLLQRHGTARIGALFGPVMLIWFIVIAVFGAMSIARTPQVVAAIDPGYAVGFFLGEPGTAFLALGSVVLCVTGAEALYADMGQFGRGPIRFSWFAIAVPALYLNYFGQAALVLRDHSASVNPFYLMVPDSLQLPMVLLATVATVIASQAVISGAFSMTRQAVRLGYLPRLTIRHTSQAEQGQIYVPAVNWFLMVAVIGLIVAFRTADNLAAAYGIAVTGTFVITTCLITVVALRRWLVSPWLVWPVTALFLIIDLSFFASNLTKFDHGGWFPLLIAVVIFTLLTTWRRGRTLMLARLSELAVPLREFAELARDPQIIRLPGTAVYLAPDPRATPYALMQHARQLKVLSEQSIILHIKTVDQPEVRSEDRITISHPAPDIVHVVARIGFMERFSIPRALALAGQRDIGFDPATCTYVVHVVSVEPSAKAKMWLPRQQLFAVMQRTSVDPVLYLHLPHDQVFEVGAVVSL